MDAGPVDGGPDAGLDGGADGGADGGVALATAAEFLDATCGDISAALCTAGAQCGCVHSDGTMLDASACASSREAQCRSQAGPLVAAVQSGAVVVLRDRLAACVEAYRASVVQCQGPRTEWLRGVCDSTLSTKDALGAPCTEPVCAYGRGSCSQGTCVALPAVGQPCEGLCGPGAACWDGTCRDLMPAGSGCGAAAPCEPGLECLGGVCQALTGPGGPCATEATCASGLTCTAGRCASPGACSGSGTACGNLAVCAVPQRRLCAAEGEADAGCSQDAACAAGLYCDGTTTSCQPPPALGQACGNGAVCEAAAGCASDTATCGPLPGDGGACALGSEGPFLCEDGLACRDGTCGPVPGQGDPCAIPNRCGPGLACDFTPNGSVCSPRRGADAGCQNDAICDDGLFCDYGLGQCAPFRPSGSACSAGNECGSGSTCMPGAAGGFVCTSLPARGSTCFFDCAPGSWCESTPLPGVCHAELCPVLVGG